jgi:hypothetical protein
MRTWIGWAVLAIAGCQQQDEAMRVARGFVDAHYVAIDLESAKRFTSGLATKKIDEEQRLLQGVEAGETAEKPRVNYKILERRPEGDDRVSFVFAGEARIPDSEVFTRKWLVTVRRENAAWKVSNFDEYD